ncbi:Eukaryotic translation initiation factor 3 subunit D [Saguinus oedipus]|uniref:Eukaryotic translation initiation factor 3 subunit D n=1 Tax=Saguinus oedipus TaxID=9490 RepID=A0ABQ9VYE6_SAGOE|nr:Eukaryotic translation initiation factor 3 subunit D [Saguinus oedipus]
MPYLLLSKEDRLGKISDWTGAMYQDNSWWIQRTQKRTYQCNRMRFAQRNLHRDKDRQNTLQFNLQILPKSAKQKERESIRLQKKFLKQFGVRQKWDQKSQKPKTLQLKFVVVTGR